MSLSDSPRKVGEGVEGFGIAFARNKIGAHTIAVDLDGTLCPHEWIDEETIVSPFEGARDFLKGLSKVYNVVIFSARATNIKGKTAIIRWLMEHRLSLYIYDVTNKKNYNFLKFIDDRAIPFKEPNDYNKILKELDVEY